MKRLLAVATVFFALSGCSQSTQNAAANAANVTAAADPDQWALHGHDAASSATARSTR